MRRSALIITLLTTLVAPGLRGQAPGDGGGLEARVWLDRGDEPVLRRGETVRVFYRATENAYAAIFRIDTDGRISMIVPQDPSADTRLNGGVDYRVIFPTSPVWLVKDDPGVGYLFMVASPEPLDFSAFTFDAEFGWDLRSVADVVYEDPYVAIDDYVAALIPDWESAPYALDFVTYNVGDTYTYPRFLCYDCHEARPYASWNPYALSCTSVRVVVWDDPYFYPAYRYSGMNVVVARPVVTQPRYGFTVRAPGDSYRPLIRTRPAPPRTVADFKESPGGRTSDGAVRRSSEPAPAAQQIAPRPTLQRRPSDPSARLPVRTPPSAGGSAARGSDAPAPGATIVRPSRPTTSTSGRPSQGLSPSGGGSGDGRPTTRPAAPSTRSAPSRPSAQPAPSRPSTSTRSAPSRPSAQPAPSRPSTSSQPAAPSGRSAAPARPTVQPRSRTPSR